MSCDNIKPWTEIYINAYPRSGTAWLTRLLNDILPRDRYVVRRGHFTLRNGELGAGRFYELGEMGERQKPKWFGLSDITDEKLIFLVRDPRDICVSGAWLWQQPIEQFLDRMIAGKVIRCGRWDWYYEKQLLSKLRHHSIIFSGSTMAVLKYEDLLRLTHYMIGLTFNSLDLDIEPYDLRAMDAIQSQSFTVYKTRIGNDEQALRKAGLRKGIAGDWHNHFTKEMNDKIWSEFGWMMERLGYEK